MMDDERRIAQLGGQASRWGAAHLPNCLVCGQPWTSGPSVSETWDTATGEPRESMFGIVGPMAHFQCMRCHANVVMPISSMREAS
jgi:hypothetical protein